MQGIETSLGPWGLKETMPFVISVQSWRRAGMSECNVLVTYTKFSLLDGQSEKKLAIAVKMTSGCVTDHLPLESSKTLLKDKLRQKTSDDVVFFRRKKERKKINGVLKCWVVVNKDYVRACAFIFEMAKTNIQKTIRKVWKVRSLV